MKKIISLLLCLCLMGAFFVTPVWADEDTETETEPVVRQPGQCGEDLYWSFAGGTLTITGSGAFFGATAYADFLALANVFAENSWGGLIHPVFGTYRCYFTELRLTQEPRKDYVAYQFEFREADLDGNIPQ